MVPVIVLRSQMGYDVDAASAEAALVFSDVSMTKQSFAEDADINVIVRRFGLSGEMPPQVAMPQYGDFTSVVDFHTAMNVVAAAREGFDSMTAEVRTRFHNDPAELLQFLADPANKAEAQKLGLVVVPAVLPVVAAADLAPPPAPPALPAPAPVPAPAPG